MKWEEPKLVDLADRLKSFGACASGIGQNVVPVCKAGNGEPGGCAVGSSGADV